MSGTFEETLLSVWRQAMVEDLPAIVLKDARGQWNGRHVGGFAN